MMWFLSVVLLLFVLLLLMLFLLAKTGNKKFVFPKNWDKASMEIKLNYIKRQLAKGAVTQQQYKTLYKIIHREEAERRFSLEKKKGAKRSKASKKGSGKKKSGGKRPPGRRGVATKGSKRPAAPRPQSQAIRKRSFAKTPTAVKAAIEDDYDFEDDLRKELGMDKKKEESFEEELRKICNIGRQRRKLRSGPMEEMLLRRTETGDEYILPTVKIVETDFKEEMDIDEIFLMNQDGLLIKHFAFSKTSIIDEDLLASMLMVIQNFIVDSFGNRKETDLKQLHMGDFNLSINKGEYFIAVAISRDEDLKNIERSIEHMLREIESINQGVCQDWNGDIDAFKGIEQCIDKLVENEY